MAPTKKKKSVQKKSQMNKNKKNGSAKTKSATNKSAAKTSMKAKSQKSSPKSTTKKPKLSPSKAKKVATKTPKATAKSKSSTDNKWTSDISRKASAKPKGKTWLQPLDDRLLIEVAEQPKQTPGGIIIVDSAETTENLRGFVIAVGRGHQNKKGRIRPIEAKAGDKVIFSKYAGDKISHDGVNFVVIRETDILGFASN